MLNKYTSELTKTVYGRIQLVLLVLFVLTAVWAGMLSIRATNVSDMASEQSQECHDYLMSRDETWTATGDGYYNMECDHENPYSMYSIRNKQERSSYDDVDQAFAALGILLALMGGAALTRWLLTGRISI